MEAPLSDLVYQLSDHVTARLYSIATSHYLSTYAPPLEGIVFAITAVLCRGEQLLACIRVHEEVVNAIISKPRQLPQRPHVVREASHDAPMQACCTTEELDCTSALCKGRAVVLRNPHEVVGQLADIGTRFEAAVVSHARACQRVVGGVAVDEVGTVVGLLLLLRAPEDISSRPGCALRQGFVASCDNVPED